jgi:hypothetical protein
MYEDAVKSYRNSLSKLSESERNKSIDRDIKTIIAIENKTITYDRKMRDKLHFISVDEPLRFWKKEAKLVIEELRPSFKF